MNRSNLFLAAIVIFMVGTILLGGGIATQATSYADPHPNWGFVLIVMGTLSMGWSSAIYFGLIFFGSDDEEEDDDQENEDNEAVST